MRALAQSAGSRNLVNLGTRGSSNAVVRRWSRSPSSVSSGPGRLNYLFFQEQQQRGISSSSSSPPAATTSTTKASTPNPGGATALPDDVIVEDDEDANEKPLPSQEIAFPWRSAPHKRLSSFEAIFKNTINILPQSYIRGRLLQVLSMRMDTSPQAITELLYRSTRFAFIQAVRGIFDGQCKTPPPTWEYSKDEEKPPSSDWELGYPILADMMDDRLTEIYQDVTARFKANKRDVRLELESVNPIAMDDFKLLIGPPRGMPLPKGSEEVEVLGIGVVVGKSPPEQEGFGVMGRWAVEQSRTVPKSNFHLRFQMAVTFKCREMFVVTNEETEEVVQGEEGVVREVEHVARFEIEFDRRAQVSQDWRLIDIDGWSNGDKYRAAGKKVNGEAPTEVPREGGREGGRKLN